MAIHTPTIGAIERTTQQYADGFRKLAQERTSARGRWMDYLRAAMLDDFDGRFRAATGETAGTLLWPKDPNSGTLVFTAFQLFHLQGLGRMTPRISFTWDEVDYSVIAVARALDGDRVRYDLDRFLETPLETQVLHHMAGALQEMHSKLVPPPSER